MRAQYGEGSIDGTAPSRPIATSQDVEPDSTTETYVALKLMIDNWRWAGVPFYLRTGKALCQTHRDRDQVQAGAGRHVPRHAGRELGAELFGAPHPARRRHRAEFNAKVPGPSIAIGGVGMTFKYEDYFDAAPSTGYETLIYDCMIGDAILYPRADGIEAGWHVVQPFMEAWRDAGGQGLATYRAGSEGPAEADRLLAHDGRRWRADRVRSAA